MESPNSIFEMILILPFSFKFVLYFGSFLKSLGERGGEKV